MTGIKPVLEPAAQEFADATANPPYLFDLSIEDGRKTVDSVQDGDIPAPAADVTDLTIAGGPSGEVLSHFSQRFRAAYGMSPHEWRWASRTGTAAVDATS